MTVSLAALPPIAVFGAVLEEVSRADAPAVKIARTRIANPGQPPIAFSIAYDPAAIEERLTYIVRPRVLVGERLLITSDRRSRRSAASGELARWHETGTRERIDKGKLGLDTADVLWLNRVLAGCSVRAIQMTSATPSKLPRPVWLRVWLAKFMTPGAGGLSSRYGARAAIAVALLILAACQSPAILDPETIIAKGGEYDFPLANPYVATVAGTPAALAVGVPEDAPVQNLDLAVIEGRATPEIFWYEDRFRYSVAAQRGKAPLIFIIAGTNAGYAANYSRFLQNLFFRVGFHAVSLSSPTFPNFMVSASTTGAPGRTSQDAADLYRVMQLCMQQLRNSIDISDIYLTGYSLGGWQAAFVARLDDQQKALGFRRVLMINPPVSLYRSSQVLDNMLADNIPGGLQNFPVFLDEMTARVTELVQRSRGVDFGQDLLYNAIREMQTTDQQLRALVGIVFRLAAANIAFTGDVVNNAGYLVPRDRRLTVSTSLTPYFNLAIQRGFRDYLDNLLYPVYKQLDPSISPSDLIEESSLESIGSYLQGADNVRLLTNADDIILAPGDIEFLERTFNGRARIFPTGGHCGNMRYRYVAGAMLQLLLQ